MLDILKARLLPYLEMRRWDQWPPKGPTLPEQKCRGLEKSPELPSGIHGLESHSFLGGLLDGSARCWVGSRQPQHHEGTNDIMRLGDVQAHAHRTAAPALTACSFLFFPQAGGKHYHPTCARCVRCHQMFTEGEEMYLTGKQI